MHMAALPPLDNNDQSGGGYLDDSQDTTTSSGLVASVGPGAGTADLSPLIQPRGGVQLASSPDATAAPHAVYAISSAGADTSPTFATGGVDASPPQSFRPASVPSSGYYYSHHGSHNNPQQLQAYQQAYGSQSYPGDVSGGGYGQDTPQSAYDTPYTPYHQLQLQQQQAVQHYQQQQAQQQQAQQQHQQQHHSSASYGQGQYADYQRAESEADYGEYDGPSRMKGDKEPILLPGEKELPRPNRSYASLIGEALLRSPPPHHLYVSEISESIKAHYRCESLA